MSDILRRLAGAVADATPVDWEMECRDHPDLAAMLERLRRIESLAFAFRATTPGSTPDPHRLHHGPLGRTVLP